MVEIRKIRLHGQKVNRDYVETLSMEIEKILKDIGFKCETSIKSNGHIRLSNVRSIKDTWPSNCSPYTHRHGRILNYSQWILVNYALNTIMDKYGLHAKISSLNGKFKIRDMDKVYVVHDWSDMEYDNVGSVMYPCYRYQAWSTSDYEKHSDFMEHSISTLKRYHSTMYLEQLEKRTLERYLW